MPELSGQSLLGVNIALRDELELWLMTATRGLCADAAVRVRDEVTSHCVAACEGKQRDGVTPIMAAIRTVDELGEAKKANRRYCRFHLTRRGTVHSEHNGREVPRGGLSMDRRRLVRGVCHCDGVYESFAARRIYPSGVRGSGGGVRDTTLVAAARP